MVWFSAHSSSLRAKRGNPYYGAASGLPRRWGISPSLSRAAGLPASRRVPRKDGGVFHNVLGSEK